MGLSSHQIVSETLGDLMNLLMLQVLQDILVGMENQKS